MSDLLAVARLQLEHVVLDIGRIDHLIEPRISQRLRRPAGQAPVAAPLTARWIRGAGASGGRVRLSLTAPAGPRGGRNVSAVWSPMSTRTPLWPPARRPTRWCSAPSGGNAPAGSRKVKATEWILSRVHDMLLLLPAFKKEAVDQQVELIRSFVDVIDEKATHKPGEWPEALAAAAKLAGLDFAVTDHPDLVERERARWRRLPLDGELPGRAGAATAPAGVASRARRSVGGRSCGSLADPAGEGGKAEAQRHRQEQERRWSNANVGKSLGRADAVEKVTGDARFVGDLTLPGTPTQRCCARPTPTPASCASTRRAPARCRVCTRWSTGADCPWEIGVPTAISVRSPLRRCASRASRWPPAIAASEDAALAGVDAITVQHGSRCRR